VETRQVDPRPGYQGRRQAGNEIKRAKGNTPDSGVNASPDQEEFDITVDYRFQTPLLEGLWLRARAAFVVEDDDVAGASDVDDIRVILNYELPIL
jgi:hypothetical protein